MRIITRNNIERIHKCSYCKSIFAYTAIDIRTRMYDTVDCPVCNHTEEVSCFDKKVK